MPALDEALSTGCVHSLSREAMPNWAREVKTVTGAWLYFQGGVHAVSTGHLSTGGVHAYVDVERYDPANPIFKYDRYFFIRMVDGRVFQAGPFKDIEYGHHRDDRPHWLGDYCSESTG